MQSRLRPLDGSAFGAEKLFLLEQPRDAKGPQTAYNECEHLSILEIIVNMDMMFYFLLLSSSVGKDLNKFAQKQLLDFRVFT